MDNEPQTDKQSSVQISSTVISKRKGTSENHNDNNHTNNNPQPSPNNNGKINNIRRRSTSSQQFKNHQFLITQNILHPHKDKVQLIEKLVSKNTKKFRYLVVICREQTHALLGIDMAPCAENNNNINLASVSENSSSSTSSSSQNCKQQQQLLPLDNHLNSLLSTAALSSNFNCTLGLVVPIWSHMEVNLNGDGGFALQCNESRHEFTPVSVHGLWSVIQKVSRCIQQAQKQKHYLGSGAHTWTLEYATKVNSDRISRAEWEYLTDLWSSRNDEQFALTAQMENEEENEDLRIRQTIRAQLKAVMRTLDLEEVSSKDVRIALQSRMKYVKSNQEIEINLTKYSKFIDTEMLTVLGQMEASSQILPYLYLGSEWNASNRDELLENNVGFILNVTQEIDNFFPEDFEYKNVRLHDIPSSSLSPFFNDTYAFIEKAKNNGKSCLVHCKMGISRSAATVIAYLMKKKEYDIGKATQFVRDKRSIIAPNEGFQRQLFEYDGILRGSRCVRKFESAMSFHGTTNGALIADKLCWSDDDTSTTENTNSESKNLNLKLIKSKIESKSTRSVQTIINEYENRCASAMEINYNIIQNSSENSSSENNNNQVLNSSERTTYLSRSHSLPSSPKKRDNFRKRYRSRVKLDLQSDKSKKEEGEEETDKYDDSQVQNVENSSNNQEYTEVQEYTEIPENTLMENTEILEQTEIPENSQLITLIDHTLIEQIDAQTIDGQTIDGFQLDTLPLDSVGPSTNLNVPHNKKSKKSLLSDEDCSSSAMSATTDSVGKVSLFCPKSRF